ncbi:biotin--[acetyl-CoA-carboxylase] ligase [Reinekea forsetii]|jgi:BirA family biotin operon repressor/biotin-[acetyl-CoA-carboxylase] ligase|uniref:Bifunctional ligase/repressor BirA n=1 Tax=Reinekea forsetii TaxID=1336806 RepID=A0A2K8KZR2_9GAMM|nr:biotin--[acetyl-CoA-carboxylase] ligase [Reinekea forsetii]ATX78254.1 bifunctional biotin--[acetyl-CoA-carboxylase] synthetase/biotin operon repressor [Reinekea forsetii]
MPNRRVENVFLKQLLTLLSLLQGQDFVSGQDLSAALNVSRPTIASWVKDLESSGLLINKIRGRGYRLLTPIQPIDSKQVSAKLSAAGRDIFPVIDIVAQTDSTNKTALGAVYQLDEWKLFSAEFQQAGRGRRGKVWQSPPCTNLTFSLGHRAIFEVGVLYLSSLLVGVAVATALEQETGLPVQLKWPNDLYCRDKKLAGILCELQGSPIDEATLVIGVGINVASAPTDTANAATSLLVETGRLLPRDLLLVKMAEAIVNTFAAAKCSGTWPILAAWRSRDFLYGRSIGVHQGDRVTTGTAQGIDEKGQLIVLDDSGTLRLFNGGEVSVRW